MKKTILLSLFVIINVFAFSQTKYNTFTDSIKFDPNLPYTIENYGVSSIPASDGYIFTGTINNWLDFNYYFAKLDISGNILFDKVVTISPIATGGPVASICSRDITPNGVTLWSSFQNPSNQQPLIINFDLDGNYLGSKYYAIDTLSFQVNGGVRGSDGNLYSYGSLYDYTQGIGYGFILKTDLAGTIAWSKFYALKVDTLTNSWGGNIENLTETPDGGFLFSSRAADSLSVNYPTITKIDSNGDIQWTNALVFSAPYGNGGEMMTSVKSILPIDENNMLLALDLGDNVTYTTRLGLIAINPISGVQNWTKSHYLGINDGGLSLQKMIRKSDGNFVGYYDGYNGSVLVELNQFGTMINSTQLRELSIGGTNTYYNGLDQTNDGGVIITANLSTYPGALLFKTDKNLITNCPNTEIPATIIEDTLDVVFLSSLDTSFAVTFTEQVPSLGSPMAITPSISDPYCSCVLNIYGSISYSSSFYTADSVMVFLYEISPTGSYVKRDSVLSNADGMYQFSFLLAGNYVVKAVPSITRYPDYVPTYFGILNPTTQWDSALVIHQECGFNSVSNNINLIQKLPQTGSWTCSGYVLEYYGYNAGTNKAAGEPIPDIDITIDQSPGGSVSSATTDNSGYFEFTGLNNNVTFIVKADIPGLPNDSIYTFTVNPGDGPLDSLNFYVDTVGVYILPEYILTGVNVIKSKNVNVDIAPNPTNANFNLEINAEVNTTMKISLSNSVGQVIFNKNITLNIGENKIQFDIKDYPSGIYYMNISNENDHFIKKIVKL